MNIAVRYQSRGGNTRAAAQVIADELGIRAYPIDTVFTEPVDLLFLGGGVYAWNADEKLLAYLEQLNKTQIGKIAPFSTTGAMTVTIKRIKEAAEKTGIPVTEEALCLKVMLQGHAALGREGGHLTPEQIQKVRKFAQNAVKES